MKKILRFRTLTKTGNNEFDNQKDAYEYVQRHGGTIEYYEWVQGQPNGYWNLLKTESV